MRVDLPMGHGCVCRDSLRALEVSPFILGDSDLKVPGNPAPIAVGGTTMSSNEALKAGLRGKALRILTLFNVNCRDSADDRYVPNGGFYDDIVVEDPNYASPSQPIKDEESAVEILESHTTDPAIHIEAIEDLTAGVSEVKLPEDKTSEEPTEEREHQNLSTEEIDSLLDKCLLQALHTSLKDKVFPILGSSLWSNHILPCRPPGVTLDIKKSSYKKLSKLLLSKSSSGLFNLVCHFSGSFDMVCLILVCHITKQLEVAEIYKPSSHVNPIFMAVGADAGKYIEKGNLVKPTDKAKVILDALYKGAIKKGSAYPAEIHEKDLGSTFSNRMQIHRRVARGNEVAIRTVQIMTERRQVNKKMTRLSGLECFLMNADSLACGLQKKFACSTTTAELPGEMGKHEVSVQGGAIDDLAKHLVDDYGVPKRSIEVLDKTKR
ncbi:hypothetical protein ABZP36_032434 [Zizania latifolia]